MPLLPLKQVLLPNHVEMSYQLLSGVYLWPAMEAYYPLFLDFDAVASKLRKTAKRPRTGSRRRCKPRTRVAFPHTATYGDPRRPARA